MLAIFPSVEYISSRLSAFWRLLTQLCTYLNHLEKERCELYVFFRWIYFWELRWTWMHVGCCAVWDLPKRILVSSLAKLLVFIKTFAIRPSKIKAAISSNLFRRLTVLAWTRQERPILVFQENCDFGNFPPFFIILLRYQVTLCLNLSHQTAYSSGIPELITF